jgi:hypothetical protein
VQRQTLIKAPFCPISSPSFVSSGIWVPSTIYTTQKEKKNKIPVLIAFLLPSLFSVNPSGFFLFLDRFVTTRRWSQSAIRVNISVWLFLAHRRTVSHTRTLARSHANGLMVIIVSPVFLFVPRAASTPSYNVYYRNISDFSSPCYPKKNCRGFV